MKKEITINDNLENLTILLPRKGNTFIIILTGIWSIAFVVFLITIIYGQISDNRFLIELNLFFLFFLIVWLFVLKAFLWNIRGIEKVTLDKDNFKIEKLGTILSMPYKYESNLIDKFESTSDEKWADWIKMYGFSGGKIIFNYMENSKYFGQTISKSQAEEIAELLTAKINAIKRVT